MTVRSPRGASRTAVRRSRSVLPAVGVFAALGLLAGCASRGGVVRIPQLEGAQRDLGTPVGERSRAHDACRATAAEAEELVTCMERAGYRFIGQSLDARARDCWEQRRSPDGQPAAYCFETDSPARWP